MTTVQSNVLPIMLRPLLLSVLVPLIVEEHHTATYIKAQHYPQYLYYLPTYAHELPCAQILLRALPIVLHMHTAKLDQNEECSAFQFALFCFWLSRASKEANHSFGGQ